MKTKQILFSVLVTGALGLFSACSNENKALDGNWSPMKWKTEVKTVKDKGGRYIKVPKEGGTYTFKCMNYGNSFWLSQAEEIQEGKSNRYFAGQSNSVNRDSWYSLKTAWSDIKRVGPNLVVVIQPQGQGSERILNLSVTAGDVFDYFTFKQTAGN